MKWLIAGLLAASVLSAGEMEVTAGRVNVRQAPSTRSAVVGTLKSGERIPVRQIKDGWAELDGREGFVSANYLRPVPPPQARPEGPGPDHRPPAAAPASRPPEKKPAPKPKTASADQSPFPDLPIVPNSAKDVTVEGYLHPVQQVKAHIRYALLQAVNNEFKIACYIYTPRADAARFKLFAGKNVRLVGTWYKIQGWKMPVMKVRRLQEQ